MPDETTPKPQRLTTHDASFLYTETPNGPMHGASIGIFEGVIPFEQLREFMAARIHLVPRYRQRLVFVPMNLHHPVWVDDPDFELSNHVVHHRLAPGSTLDDGIRAALEIAEPPLDRTRPMWKSVLIEGVPDRTLLLSIAHHCMIDGLSGVELSTVLMDFQPDSAPPEPPTKAWAPAPLPTEQELLAEAARDRSLEQFNSFFASYNLISDPARAARRATTLAQAARATMPEPGRPVVTAPFNRGLVGPHRTVAWRKWPFALIRALRGAHGGTVNDVMLSATSEAVARYIAGEGYRLQGQYLRIMCPVSVRREFEGGSLGNRVSGMFPVLPAWPMDALERHAAVVRETTARKEAAEAQSLEVMMEIASSAPPSAMAFAAAQPGTAMPAGEPPLPPRPLFLPPLPGGFNFTVSNVPGVMVPQYMAGHRLLDSVGTIMLGGTLGFGAVVSTYNQWLYANLTAEPRLLPEVERVAAHVEDVIKELVAAGNVEGAGVEPVELARAG